MKMLDKERRRKKCRERDQANSIAQDTTESNNSCNTKKNTYDVVGAIYNEATSDVDNDNENVTASEIRPKFEIHTDDFVVMLLWIVEELLHCPLYK